MLKEKINIKIFKLFFHNNVNNVIYLGICTIKAKL